MVISHRLRPHMRWLRFYAMNQKIRTRRARIQQSQRKSSRRRYSSMPLRIRRLNRMGRGAGRSHWQSCSFNHQVMKAKNEKKKRLKKRKRNRKRNKRKETERVALEAVVGKGVCLMQPTWPTSFPAPATPTPSPSCLGSSTASPKRLLRLFRFTMYVSYAFSLFI